MRYHSIILENKHFEHLHHCLKKERTLTFFDMLRWALLLESNTFRTIPFNFPSNNRPMLIVTGRQPPRAIPGLDPRAIHLINFLE